MIPTTHQLNPAPKRTEKRILKERHADGIKAIHARVKELPAEYLIVHQESDPNAVHKYRALNKAKRLRKAAKQL